MNHKCEYGNCNKEFIVKKNTKGRYCSKECYWEDSTKRRGARGNGWRGGIWHHGPYIQIYSPNHPFKEARGYVFEHRLVMEKYLGRYLTKNEVIHHLDGNGSNNNLDNLKLMSRGEHAHEHHKGAKRSPESCARIKLINIGRVRSAETRKKVGDANRLRVVSEATKLKHSNDMKRIWAERRLESQ